MSMFKTEYIRDDLALFGPFETVRLIENKLVRMGKSRKIARIMAYNIVKQFS